MLSWLSSNFKSQVRETRVSNLVSNLLIGLSVNLVPKYSSFENSCLWTIIIIFIIIFIIIISSINFQASELHSHSSAERTFPLSGRHSTFRFHICHICHKKVTLPYSKDFVGFLFFQTISIFKRFCIFSCLYKLYHCNEPPSRPAYMKKRSCVAVMAFLAKKLAENLA